MKILHTADWHLGKKLGDFSRIEEQRAVLEEIIDIAEVHDVDIVIIAGDLFDNGSPSIEATELFYQTLKRLSNNGKRPVIAIAGNHDSAERIDAPDPLAKACGIILIGQPAALIQPFALKDFAVTLAAPGFIELQLSKYNYPFRLLHTAFANEQRLKTYLSEDKAKGLNTVLTEQWKELADEYCNEEGINFLTAHLYMNKYGEALIEEPDGERPIQVGNADLIFTEVIPESIQYSALGHIHRFKNMGTTERPIVYASAPLCYSFSEAGLQKYVVIIDAQPNQAVSYEAIKLNAGKPLVRVQFDDIDQAIIWLQDNPDALVELTIESDTYIKAVDRKRIYSAHNGIVYLIPKISLEQNAISTENQIDLTQDLQSLFKAYFKSAKGQEPNEEIIALFNEINQQQS